MAEDAKKAGVIDAHRIALSHAGRVGVGQLFAPTFHIHGPLTNCLLQEGTTNVHENFGNEFNETFEVSIGPGFHCVNVQLSGWSLNFSGKNRKIDHVKVRISDVGYDVSSGGVTFRVSGVYRDKAHEHDFEWEVWYTILAIG